MPAMRAAPAASPRAAAPALIPPHVFFSLDSMPAAPLSTPFGSMPTLISRSASVDTRPAHLPVEPLHGFEHVVPGHRPGLRPRDSPLRHESVGLVRFLFLAPVDVRDRGLQHREEVVKPLISDRAGDPLVRLPFGQLARVDPREQLAYRAAQSES